MTYQPVKRRNWPRRQIEDLDGRFDHSLHGLSVNRLPLHDEISIRFVTLSTTVWFPGPPARNHYQVSSATVATEHKGSKRPQIIHLSSPKHYRTRTVAEDRPRGAVMGIQDSGEYISSYYKHPVGDTGGNQADSISKRIYEARANRTHVESRDPLQTETGRHLGRRRGATAIRSRCRKDQRIYRFKLGRFKCALSGLDR